MILTIQLICKRNDTLDMLPEDETLNFYFPYMPRPLADSGKIAVYNVPLKRYCATLREHIKGTRGKDLRGTSTTKNIADVFRQLSVPWEVLAKDFAEKCISAVSMFLRAACYEAGGDHTGADLLQAYVLEPDSRFQHRRARLNLKIEELLWPYTECHPMTSRLEFNAALASQAYTNGNLGDKSWVDLATDAPGYTEGMVEAAGILAQTESYYKVSHSRLHHVCETARKVTSSDRTRQFYRQCRLFRHRNVSAQRLVKTCRAQ